MRSNLHRLGLLIILVTFALVLVSGSSVVEGTSMEPTLHDGDILIYTKFPIKINAGDIVLVHNSTVGGIIVKRVIGLSKDTVKINNGEVVVNDSAIYDPYCDDWAYTMNTIEVPNNYIFVLGDNRNNSLDSRQLGCLSLSSVEGKLLFNASAVFGENFTVGWIKAIIVLIYIIGATLYFSTRR